jgi:hypothetical protein
MRKPVRAFENGHFPQASDALNFPTDEAIHAYFPQGTGLFRAPVRLFNFDLDDRMQ